MKRVWAAALEHTIRAVGHWVIGALGHWDIGTLGHWDTGTLGHLGRWGIGALRHDPNLDPHQVISELMLESADLPDLVQARLALTPIPTPNPYP